MWSFWIWITVSITGEMILPSSWWLQKFCQVAASDGKAWYATGSSSVSRLLPGKRWWSEAISGRINAKNRSDNGKNITCLVKLFGNVGQMVQSSMREWHFGDGWWSLLVTRVLLFDADYIIGVLTSNLVPGTLFVSSFWLKLSTNRNPVCRSIELLLQRQCQSPCFVWILGCSCGSGMESEKGNLMVMTTFNYLLYCH